jgi:predicted lipase
MPSEIFSIPQAVELGEFVLSAYDLFVNPAAFTMPAGYALVSHIFADDITDNDPAYKVFGFIARSGSDVVIAIRGTEGVFEWAKDVEFGLVRFPYLNAGHSEQGFTGFYSTLRIGPDNTQLRVIEALANIVADGSVTRLRITGHSLGAALATMLAIDVAGNNVFAKPVVYTFASPRVGDKIFAGTYDGLVETSWRISNLNDRVPQLPPEFVGYTHVDAEHPINSDDRCKHTYGCWHSLDTYLNVLDSSTPLDAGCDPRPPIAAPA